MKRRISLSLVALMMLGLMASCSSYGAMSANGHQCRGVAASNHR